MQIAGMLKKSLLHEQKLKSRNSKFPIWKLIQDRVELVHDIWYTMQGFTVQQCTIHE